MGSIWHCKKETLNKRLRGWTWNSCSAANCFNRDLHVKSAIWNRKNTNYTHIIYNLYAYNCMDFILCLGAVLLQTCCCRTGVLLCVGAVLLQTCWCHTVVSLCLGAVLLQTCWCHTDVWWCLGAVLLQTCWCHTDVSLCLGAVLLQTCWCHTDVSLCLGAVLLQTCWCHTDVSLCVLYVHAGQSSKNHDRQESSVRLQWDTLRTYTLESTKKLIFLGCQGNVLDAYLTYIILFVSSTMACALFVF